MSERERYPSGVPCWIDTAQPDPEAAIGFYGGLFGWEFNGPGQMPGDPPGKYYVARLRGKDVAGVGSQPPNEAPPVPAWTTYVAADSADAATVRAREAGATVLVGPFDAPPAGRIAVLLDPTGAVFCIWEAGARHGAQLVNEPSAWAMSALNTNDPDRATAFYGAVFGWEAEAFGPVTLFRLPGYVGGEPQQPVPRDVVAVMSAGADAGWGVDLWVSDADATALRAAELGGEVIAGPRDVPGFRNSVIADPQGAVLSVSQLIGAGSG